MDGGFSHEVLFIKEFAMNYPKKLSNRRRARRIGFRARMRKRGGRKIINRKRRKGRKVQVV